MQIKVLELFSGTRSIAKAFEERRHQTYTVEIDKQHSSIDWYEDVLKITSSEIISRFGRPAVIWASPPCTTYSISAISHHRFYDDNHTLCAKSQAAKTADLLVKHTLNLIYELNPCFWFIENPRGGLRKMRFMEKLPRYTLTYCQYGDKRMKPTDIWTNHPIPDFRPMCKNGDNCHESAPRGSKTGTQGLKNAVIRSTIPYLLCSHIVDICERSLSNSAEIFGGD